MDAANPLFQAIIVPLVLGLALAIMLQVVGRKGWGGLAVLAGILVGYVLFKHGVPSFPPPQAIEKLFYLAIGAALLGLIVELAGAPPALERAALVLAPAAVVLWLVWRRLIGGPDLEFIVIAAVVWLGGTAFLFGLRETDKAGGAVSAAIAVVAAAIGFAIVAHLGRSDTLALHAGTVAAAAGALGLLGLATQLFAGRRDGFGLIGVLTAGTAFVTLAAVLALYTPTASRWALLLLILVPLAGTAVRPPRFQKNIPGTAANAAVAALVAAIPALAAVGLAYLAAD